MGTKQSRHVDVDVDAEDEEAISNTANSMETLGDTVDEGEDDELIHENMGESKKGLGEETCCVMYFSA